jgi:hypothetical protein
MDPKKVPKRYKGFRIKIVKSNRFVGSWTPGKKVIYINYYYVIKPNVDINDVKAIFEHEIEEMKHYYRGDPILIAHSKAAKKEKEYLKKRGIHYKHHQREVIDVYRKRIKDDAPWLELKNV